jgi:hypothetical protein
LDSECQISLPDGNSRPEFERWFAFSAGDSKVDFRRIQRLGSGFRDLSDCVVDLSGFEEGDEIDVSRIGSCQFYRWCDDGLEIVLKLFGEFDQDRGCEIDRKNDEWDASVYHCSFWICSSDSIRRRENCEIVHSERFVERCSFGSSGLVDPNSENYYDCRNCA